MPLRSMHRKLPTRNVKTNAGCAVSTIVLGFCSPNFVFERLSSRQAPPSNPQASCRARNRISSNFAHMITPGDLVVVETMLCHRRHAKGFSMENMHIPGSSPKNPLKTLQSRPRTHVYMRTVERGLATAAPVPRSPFTSQQRLSVTKQCDSEFCGNQIEQERVVRMMATQAIMT